MMDAKTPSMLHTDCEATFDFMFNPTLVPFKFILYIVGHLIVCVYAKENCR
jgi:hypothetical protein